jgi:hypothetical protein
MNAATASLHRALIRLAKGAITAWEDWLKAMNKNTTTTAAPRDGD